MIGRDGETDSTIGDGVLNGPTHVVLGPDGTVYVADWGNNRVKRFGLSGELQADWGNGEQFQHPAGIALDQQYLN